MIDESSPAESPLSPPAGVSPATSGIEQPTEFLPLYQSPATHRLGALFGYILIALLVHAGFVAAVVRGDNVSIWGGFDGPYYYWRWLSALDGIQTLTWLDTEAFFPFGFTGTWGEPFFLPALVGYPLVYLGLPTVSVFGLLLLSATIATGYYTYRLCYQLTGNSFAAFSGGATFATAAFFGHGGAETPLSFAFFLPLIASATLSVLARSTVPRSLGLGLLTTAAFYSSMDLTVIAVTLAITLGFSLIVIHPGRFGGGDYLKIGVGFVVGALPIGLFLLPASSAAPHLGSFSTTETLGSAASLTQLLTPPRLSPLGCGGEAPIPLVGCGALILIAAAAAFKRLAEARILRGVAIVLAVALLFAGGARESPELSAAIRHGLAISGWIGLLAGGILLYRLGAIERRLGVAFVSNRAIIASFTIAGAVTYLVSLGPVDASNEGVGLSMYAAFNALLGRIIPFETPAYSAVGTLFALTIMATFTFVRGLRRLGKRLWIAPLLGLIVVVENNRTCSIESFPTDTSAIFARLKELEPGVVAAIPLRGLPAPTTRAARRVARRADAAMLTALHARGLPAVNGASFHTPEYFTSLAGATRDFPSAGSIKALSAIPGLRYVIVRTGSAQVQARGLMDRAAQHAEAVRYLDADGAGNYLFEFIPTSRVRSDFELLVPVSPQGIVTLELQALYEKGEPSVPIKVLLGKSDSRSVTEVTLKANGQWQSLSVPIPPLKTGGAPVALRFDVADRSKVLVRHPRFVRVGLNARSTAESN